MSERQNHFDGRIAANYDRTSAPMFDAGVIEPTVDFLAALAAKGPALELGIGTGRIALPLAERGIPVSGIELSPAMVDELATLIAAATSERDSS